VDPEPQGTDGSYFPLRDSAIDSATRAVYWTEESAKHVIIFQINFTPVGVSTLVPDILWVKPGGDSTRYRYSCRLRKTFSSSDSNPVLLYELSDELLQIV
jgi:hypothetical protein